MRYKSIIRKRNLSNTSIWMLITMIRQSKGEIFQKFSSRLPKSHMSFPWRIIWVQTRRLKEQTTLRPNSISFLVKFSLESTVDRKLTPKHALVLISHGPRWIRWSSIYTWNMNISIRSVGGRHCKNNKTWNTLNDSFISSLKCLKGLKIRDQNPFWCYKYLLWVSAE